MNYHGGDAVSRSGGCCPARSCRRPGGLPSREPLHQAANARGRAWQILSREPFPATAHVGESPGTRGEICQVALRRSLWPGSAITTIERTGSGPSSPVRNSRRVSRPSSKSAAGPWTVPFGNSIVPSPRQLSQSNFRRPPAPAHSAPAHLRLPDFDRRIGFHGVFLSVATVIGDGSRLEIDIIPDHARTP